MIKNLEKLSYYLQKHPNTTGLFYYSGHGFEENGVLYLEAIDSKHKDDNGKEIEANTCCISLNFIKEKMFILLIKNVLIIYVY